MNPMGRAISLAYALMLLACALFAGFDTWAFAFEIGDGGGQIDPLMGTLMIATLAGGAGLVIAAFGSWTRWRAFSIIAFASGLLVLPAAVLFGWQNGRASWLNTRAGVWHYGLWDWTTDFLPPLLGIAIAVLSWLRFRRLRRPAYPATTARMN